MTDTETQTSEARLGEGDQSCFGTLQFIFDRVEDDLGVNVFSEAYVWNTEFSQSRFGAILGSKGRQTLLEAVVHGSLTSQQRSVMFPTTFHPGSDQCLESNQCTYQAVADAVARTCKFSDGTIDEKFVKQTAHDLAKITGFSVAEHRAADPIRFARTVWLFAYLKKKRGPGVVGMLKHPGKGVKPSLELTNPYGLGTQNEMRSQFADVATYLSLQIPAKRRERIENCLQSLMPALEKGIDAIMRVTHWRYVGQQVPSDAVIKDRLRGAKQYYEMQLEGLQALADQSAKPFDEALYIHVRTLEVRHFAKFRAILKEMPSQRPELPQFRFTGIAEAPPQLIDDIDEEISVESYRIVAEKLFKRSINKTEVLKATQLARDVLRHYLPMVMRDPLALKEPIQFATMLASVMYSLNLGKEPSAHSYNPHVYGQGRVPTSLVSVIKGRSNDRHEEFEHMINDAVQWYRAALLRGLDLHQQILAMRDGVEQGVAKLCATNDLVVLEKALSLLRRVPSAWWGQGSLV